MSDGSIKRKVRDYVLMTRAGQEGLAIYHQSDTALNALHRQAYEALDLSAKGRKGRANRTAQTTAQEFLARTYYDIRMFGGVMSIDERISEVRLEPAPIIVEPTENPLWGRWSLARTRNTLRNAKRGEFVSHALVQYKEKSESADLDLRERTEVRLVRIAKQPAALTTEQR